MDKASVKTQIKQALTKLASKGLGHDGFLSGVEEPAGKAQPAEKAADEAAEQVEMPDTDKADAIC